MVPTPPPPASPPFLRLPLLGVALALAGLFTHTAPPGGIPAPLDYTNPRRSRRWPTGYTGEAGAGPHPQKGPGRRGRRQPPSWPPITGPNQVLVGGGERAGCKPSPSRWSWTLVEPQSSGIGGGRLPYLHWDGREVTGWKRSGRSAPAGAHEEQLLGPDGTPLPFARCGGQRPLGGGPRDAGHAPDGAQGAWAGSGWAQALPTGPSPWPPKASPGEAPRLHQMWRGTAGSGNDPVARRPLTNDENRSPPPGGATGSGIRLWRMCCGRVRWRGSKASTGGPVAAEQSRRPVFTGHPERPGTMTVEDLAA